MEKYFIELNKDLPKYVQILNHIKKLIDSNLVEDGEKLPPIRKISAFFKVNNDTIINAYQALELQGYAVKKMGSGTYAKKRDVGRSFKKFYSDTTKKIYTNDLKGYIDLAGEFINEKLFPVKNLKSVLNEVLDRDGASALVYQNSLGYYGLRKSINKYFWEDKLDNNNIIIVSGAQQGIDVISKAIINVNDNVIVEKPTYSGALSVFKWRRANIFEVDMESDGINIKQLEDILKKNKIKCLYVMSYFQNPTGSSYSLEKKKKILDLAQKYNFYIIEDDYLSELIYSCDIKYNSFKSLDYKDRVIYIKSFSKIFLPGIRIGYIISPNKFMESVQSSKINTDISTSSLMQRALDLYINKGFWVKHIDNLNSIYKNKYEITKKGINEILGDIVEFNDPKGGLSFYLKINKNLSIGSINLFKEALKEKVIITPGILFYKNYKDGNKFFKISFSNVEEKHIKESLYKIKEILLR